MNDPRNSRRFRDALGSFPTGITVVTSRSPEGQDFGLTATSFNSVSLDPPMVLWSIDRKSSNFDAFARVDAFAIHVLAADQEHVCRQFSAKGIDRFAGLALTRGHADVPLIAGCTAVFQCRLAHRFQGGDHVIMVGEVVSHASDAKDALLFYRGKVSGAPPAPEARMPAGRPASTPPSELVAA